MKASMHIRLLFLSLLCLSFTAQATETRALKIIATDTATKQTGEVALYNKSVAVIIGIDQYANLPQDKQLTYAVNDAKGVADVLKRQYKFDQIITLYNKEATRDRILDVLTEDLPKQLGKEDALFIFWAGHGYQESGPEGDIGYLIPHDGDVNKIRTNITMTEIRETVSKKIPAKHIFYVMDACYSGMLTETRSVDKKFRRDLAYLQDIAKERVRQVLTAGSKDQEVLDGGANGHSVFTGRFIELLEKTGDFITANEIQAIIKEKVNGDARARNHQQTPSYGTLYGSGDFVFIPSIEQNVADNKAEIARLEAELRAMNEASAKAKLSASKDEQERMQRDSELLKITLQANLKVEQLRRDQLAAEERHRQDEEAERQRLIAAKREDDSRISQLKTEVAARRGDAKVASNTFPNIEQAREEVRNLNMQISKIERGYAENLEGTIKKVKERYGKWIALAVKEPITEFESPGEYADRILGKKDALNEQMNAELSKLDTKSVSESDTTPLKMRIKELTDHIFVFGPESFETKLDSYNADTREFYVKIKSKSDMLKLSIKGYIPLSIKEAKVFKADWEIGLYSPIAKVSLNGDLLEMNLKTDISDSKNSKLMLFKNSRIFGDTHAHTFGEDDPVFYSKLNALQVIRETITAVGYSFKDCSSCPTLTVQRNGSRVYGYVPEFLLTIKMMSRCTGIDFAPELEQCIAHYQADLRGQSGYTFKFHIGDDDSSITGSSITREISNEDIEKMTAAIYASNEMQVAPSILTDDERHTVPANTEKKQEVVQSKPMLMPPSFDCAKAASKAEKLICTNSDLARSDSEMSHTYKLALASHQDQAQAIRSAQIRWRKNIRDKCSDTNCMLDVYRSRSSELTK
jgi:uncharacterized caspase-like protein